MRLLLALILFCGAGCYSVPAKIRTEIDFMDTVVDTALIELKKVKTVDQAAETSTRALLRLAPHTENLRLWVAGEGVK